MSEPVDWIARILPPDPVAAWGDNEEMASVRRLATYTSLPDGELPDIELFHALIQRQALNQYLLAAESVGLLKGRHGKELRARMASGDPSNYRGAAAECLTSWWLKEGLGLAVVARPPGLGQSLLDMGIVFGDELFAVEVKAPFRPLRFMPGEVYMGPVEADHIGAVVQCLADASKQFDPAKRNVAVLCPSLDWGIRPAVMNALTERRNLAMDAVMVLDTMHDFINPADGHEGRGRVRHRCYIVQNARRDPPPIDTWAGWPVYEGVNEEPFREPRPVGGDPRKEWVSSDGIAFRGFQVTLQ